MRRRDKKMQISRREAVKMMGLSSLLWHLDHPLKIIYRGLIDGVIAKAQAQEAGVLPRNYVVVLYHGAPVRWVWDGFLRPNGASSPYIHNTSLGNWLTTDSYTAGDNSNIEYKDVQFNLANYGGSGSIYLPVLWDKTIPVSSGGSVKMDTLLNNTCIMRGVDMEVDIGHGIGPMLVTRPNNGAPSLTGLVADNAAPDRYLAAAGFDRTIPAGGFKSRNRPISYISGGNKMEQLLEPFQFSDSVVIDNKAKQQSIEALSEMALAEIGTYAKSAKPGASTLFDSRSAAENLFKTALGNVLDEYNQAVAKYQNLSYEAARDLPNIIPEGRGTPTTVDAALASGTPYRNIRTSGADGFAVAEILIKRGLTSTVTLDAGTHWECLDLPGQNDEHRNGDRPRQVIAHSHQFRTMAAWLNEFRTALGPALFEETLVQVSAEYGRKPRQANGGDAGGSDHLSSGNVMTLFSGAIKKPLFLGNIHTGSTTGGYAGTYGAGAAVQTDNGLTTIHKKIAANSVAQILRVENISSDKPVLKEESGEIVSLAEFPKNV